MGSWSPTILGGDTPLDTIGDFSYRFCGRTDDWEDWDSFPHTMKANLEAATERDITDFIEYADDPAVAAQCVALAYMAVGAKLSPELRVLAVDACAKEDTSCWNDPDQRKKCLAEFSFMLGAYDDVTPQRPPEEGLFAAIGRQASEGRTGLVNDNVAPAPEGRPKPRMH